MILFDFDTNLELEQVKGLFDDNQL